MHDWSDENVDWQGINDAAYYIGHWLSTWARIPVTNYKEKFGTVRVYCSFGIHGIYGLWRPRYAWYPKWWPMKLDFWLAKTSCFRLFNRIVVALQVKAYVWRYMQAVKKWPHLYKEIVSQADYGELFDGKVPGYRHSDFWRKIK
jgi:hypothetical protein